MTTAAKTAATMMKTAVIRNMSSSRLVMGCRRSLQTSPHC
jgi:hypothetical protein